MKPATMMIVVMVTVMLLGPSSLAAAECVGAVAEYTRAASLSGKSEVME